MQDDHFSYKKMLLTWVLRKMKKWVNNKIKDQVSKKSKNIKRDRKIETRFSTIIQNICSFIKKKKRSLIDSYLTLSVTRLLLFLMS